MEYAVIARLLKDHLEKLQGDHVEVKRKIQDLEAQIAEIHSTMSYPIKSDNCPSIKP